MLRKSEHRFACLSYSPFRHPGSTPWGDKEPITPAQIERDLKLLAALTGCVRTYGTSKGLDQVPAVAKQLGFKVWIGAWIGSDARLNTLEIARALELSAAFPGTIERVIVGSETLLRGEQRAGALALLLADARARSTVPISYADVWEFWLRHADTLAPVVDEALVHILPYWEDIPVGIDAAVDHLFDTWTRMRERLAPLPVIVGETGWPAAGRMRGSARPGIGEQTQFFRQLQARTVPQQMPINVVEAFDQPWKAGLEGLAGGSWGLFRSDGRLRYQQAGPIPSAFSATMLASSLAAGLALGLLIVSGRPGARMIGALGGALIAILALIQIQDLGFAATGTWPWWSRCLTLLLSSLWAAIVLRDFSHAMSADEPIRRSNGNRLQAATDSLGLVAVTVYALWLGRDGRYLDLAWPALMAPVMLITLRTALAAASRPTGLPRLAGLPGLFISMILLAAAVVVLWLEGSANLSALMVVGLMTALAVCSMFRYRTVAEGR